MEQYISQNEIRRIVISDMVNKRNSFIPTPTFTSMKVRGYYGLSLLSQFHNEQGRSFDDFMFFASNNASCVTQKDEALKEIKKMLFILGSNLSNRFFRFLWQPTQTECNNNMKTIQGYWINKEKLEDVFEFFLKKKNFSADEQVKEILVDATKLLHAYYLIAA